MGSSEVETSQGQKVTGLRRFLIFINIFLNHVLNTWIISVLSIVLPPVMAEFRIEINTAQWLSTGYSLASAIVLPLTAFLINRIKTKLLYCTSVVISIIGLVICCLAKNFTVLVIGRVIQSIGTAVVSAMSSVVIFYLYPTEKRGTYMGWMGLANAITPTFAPFLAGVLCDWKGWRLVYLVCLIGFVLALLFALVTFVDVLPNKKDKLDIPSVILCIIAFGGISYASTNIGSKFVSTKLLLPLAVGVVAFIVFAILQFKVKSPFLNLRILSDKPFTLSVIGSCLLNVLIMATTIVFSVYCQIKQFSATRCSLIILFGTAFMSLFSPIAGKFFDRFGIKPLVIIGSLIAMAGSIAMSFMKMKYSYWFYTLINIPRMIAIALILWPILCWGLNSLPKEQTSHGTAISNAFKHVFGAIGSGIFGSLMTTIANKKLRTMGVDAYIYAFNVCFRILAGVAFALLILGIIIHFTKYSIKNVDDDNNEEKLQKDVKDSVIPIENKISENDKKEPEEVDISNVKQMV
eukprot:jgi/Orpsp1_1/1188183/evm.model.d7180000063060.1